MHDLPTTLEGSVRAWLAVGEGAGGRGGSPDRCFSLVEGVSLAAPKPMSPCSMVQDSRFRMRSAHVTGGFLQGRELIGSRSCSVWGTW